MTAGADEDRWAGWATTALLAQLAVIVSAALFAPYVLLGALVFAGLLQCLLLGQPRLWRRPGPPVGAPQGELARRRLAWAALSELYLDTENDAAGYDRILNKLRESRYTGHELEQILYLEVHPLLVCNLLSVAGEWVCFDLEWLEWQVVARWKKPAGGPRVLLGVSLVEANWSAVQKSLARAPHVLPDRATT